MGGAHDDLVDHHDCDSGAGDGIDGGRPGVAGAADHHALVGPHAGIAGGEGVQFLDGDADQQDRLVVFQHIGIADHRMGIEDHLQVDRLAGIGRHLRDADALEGVAEQLVALEQAAHAELALGIADAFYAGEHLGDARALQVAEFGALGGQADQ